MSRRALRGATVEDYAARKPRSALAEQLRALRAGLSLWPDRPHIIAVTAAHPKEGKTTVTKALGRLAAMNGERVIMVDCDIRHPSPTANPHLPGLVDYLQDQITLPQAIQKDPATGMDWIPSGKSEANALGLLMSATMARLLQSLRDDYDLVLLDTPPAEAITDARIVAGLADATLFCVRWRAHVAPRCIACPGIAGRGARQCGRRCADAGGHQRPSTLWLRRCGSVSSALLAATSGSKR